MLHFRCSCTVYRHNDVLYMYDCTEDSLCDRTTACSRKPCHTVDQWHDMTTISCRRLYATATIVDYAVTNDKWRLSSSWTNHCTVPSVLLRTVAWFLTIRSSCHGFVEAQSPLARLLIASCRDVRDKLSPSSACSDGLSRPFFACKRLFCRTISTIELMLCYVK